VLKEEWLMQKYDFEYLGDRWATTSDQKRRKSTKKAVHPSPPATRIQAWSLGDHQRRKEDLSVSGLRVSKPSCEVI
jgi:hypothetical protein